MRHLTIAYDTGPDQYGELSLPGGRGPHAVVVLIHGGFWRDQYRLDLMRPLAEWLADAGYATWSLEYRRVGPTGGGWPMTLADVARGIDRLRELARGHQLDLDRVGVVGHSAGGHLALWVGQREALNPSAVGGSPVVVPRLVVGQAPVSDLVTAADSGVGDGAVVDLIGGRPLERPDAYAHASPAELVPVRVEQLIVHGLDDDVVPPALTEAYARRVGLERLSVVFEDETDHMDVIDPAHTSWAPVAAALERYLRPGTVSRT